MATYFGHKDVMELLLGRRADINAINEMGDTPLHKAAFIGREVFFSLYCFVIAHFNVSYIQLDQIGYCNASTST